MAEGLQVGALARPAPAAAGGSLQKRGRSRSRRPPGPRRGAVTRAVPTSQRGGNLVGVLCRGLAWASPRSGVVFVIGAVTNLPGTLRFCMGYAVGWGHKGSCSMCTYG